MDMAGRKSKDRQTKKRVRAKNTGTKKYGQVKLKHSRMGVYSCFLGGSAFILLLICILTAFVMREKTFPFIGGLGVLCILPTVFGVRAAVKGMREREKRYVTCRVGLVGNIIILLGLVLIFIGGFK